MFPSVFMFLLVDYMFIDRLSVEVQETENSAPEQHEIYHYEIPKYFKGYQYITISAGKLRLSENSFSNYKDLKSITIKQTQILGTEPYCFQSLPKLEKLTLEECGLTKLHYNIFQYISNLTELSLIRNDISEIEEKTFNGLEHLKLVDLGSNNLEKVNPHWFKGCPLLRLVSLRDNRIKTIPSFAFNNLQTEKYDPLSVVLSYNKIETIENDAFDNLFYFNDLLLDHNHIQHISESLFKQVEYIKRLDLSYNRIKHIEKMENILSRASKLTLIGNALDCEDFNGLWRKHTACQLDHDMYCEYVV